MKTLFLNPPFHPKYSRGQRSPQVTRSGTLYYPIWLSYAAAAVEEDGHDTWLVDAIAQERDVGDVVETTRKLGPDLILIDTSTPSIENDAMVARELRSAAPDAVIGLAGPHVSATPVESLGDYPWVDFVTMREYDQTARDLARAIETGGDWTATRGIALRRDGTPSCNPEQPLIQDLDTLPFVSRTYKRHLDFRRYFYAITRWPVVTIISGRGCPYRCNYCLFPQTLHGAQYRVRSAESLVEELAYIEASFPGVKEVFIEDDTLTVNRKRMVRICEEIMRRGVRINWTCNARADVDLETLKMMRAANCRLLCVGIESGDQGVLDSVEKGIDLATIERFFRDAKKAGVMVHGCFMAGNKGETRETLEKTLELAKRLNPDTAQFFPLMVYPGTRAYEWAKTEGLIKAERYSDWLTEEGLHSTVIDREDLPHDEIVAFCDRARREFYLRPAYMAYKLRQIVRHPREAVRLVKSIKTFGKYLLKRS